MRLCLDWTARKVKEQAGRKGGQARKRNRAALHVGRDAVSARGLSIVVPFGPRVPSMFTKISHCSGDGRSKIETREVEAIDVRCKMAAALTAPVEETLVMYVCGLAGVVGVFPVTPLYFVHAWDYSHELGNYAINGAPAQYEPERSVQCLM